MTDDLHWIEFTPPGASGPWHYAHVGEGFRFRPGPALPRGEAFVFVYPTHRPGHARFSRAVETWLACVECRKPWPCDVGLAIQQMREVDAEIRAGRP